MLLCPSVSLGSMRGRRVGKTDCCLMSLWAMLLCPSVSLESTRGRRVGKNRLLSDEFLGYVTVPLSQFGVYERPESR